LNQKSTNESVEGYVHIRTRDCDSGLEGKRKERKEYYMKYNKDYHEGGGNKRAERGRGEGRERLGWMWVVRSSDGGSDRMSIER
jgi:hypothetical protein